MTATTPTATPERGASPVLRGAMELLSSMRFAIALLTVICIASVIGTVLKQHEPLNNYVNQFGPFWAETFTALRLNAVYSAWWFLLILAFLVVSTSLCIARNTPKIIADLRASKENIRAQSLLAFHHRAEARLPDAPGPAAQRIGEALAKAGWKVKLQHRQGAGAGWMVAARAGAANKIGYIAAHSAIVLICLGGLLDGDLIVRAQMLLGGKSIYSGGGMIADVPAQHRLPSTNPTFRGNILVSEGTQSSTAILNQSGGILLQELPFSIELKKFIVEHYSTGMPKLFASEIVIHDRETGEAKPARVEVNHPVSHRGIDIYQSSFDDGGSHVQLRSVPLNGSTRSFEIEGVIGNSAQLTNGQAAAADKLTLEFTALRVINVENMSGAGGAGATDVRAVDLRSSVEQRLGAANKTVTKKELRNVGPSVNYKLRDAAGQAREFHNYMLPMDLGDGVPVFLFGVRDTPAESFRYLRMPADENGAMDGFLRLRAALADPAMRAEAVRRYASHATDSQRPELAQQLAGWALDAFAGAAPMEGDANARAGLPALAAFVETRVPEAERVRTSEVLVRILNGTLFELAQLTRERAGQKPLAPSAQTQSFMAQAVMALSDAALYPAPLAFRLENFKQVQASVFQVTRSPGHYVVYLGCALLILGVFAMLYVRERRLWVWLSDSTGGSAARMALSTNRKTMDADREFARLKQALLGIEA